ncbi:MAG TPA: methyltransferase domain-containing protein [Candidatus Dormibacteraeota bacterium]
MHPDPERELSAEPEELSELLRGKGLGEAALTALGLVSRAAFLPPDQRGRAHENRALPIGYGQTCSQPWMVAVVVQALGLRPGSTVLEVGAGSGYLAAVLRAAGADRVIAIELVPELAARARRNLNRADVSDVLVYAGDGRRGAPLGGSFDAVVVSATATELAQSLLQQVAEGGCLVAPLLEEGHERLWRLARRGSSWQREDLGECRFVPLVGTDSRAAPLKATLP